MLSQKCGRTVFKRLVILLKLQFNIYKLKYQLCRVNCRLNNNNNKVLLLVLLSRMLYLDRLKLKNLNLLMVQWMAMQLTHSFTLASCISR